MEHSLRLNRAVHLLEPSNKTKSQDEPDLILLVGWMQASTRHLAKYTSAYEKLYPSARILVVETTAVDFFHSQSSDLKRIEPVLEILYGLPSDAKLLLHFFSNGGAWTSSNIARAYRQKMGRPLPATALILDSTPGKSTYRATIRAFAVGMPKNVLIRFFALSILHFYLALYKFIVWILRATDIIDKVRADLNDSTLFTTNAPRLYVYSSGDPMVDWRLVEEHKKEGNSLGYSAVTEKYLESGHCTHMQLDEERYWGAVKSLWNKSSFNRLSSEIAS